jgi:hypothetical protein
MLNPGSSIVFSPADFADYRRFLIKKMTLEINFEAYRFLPEITAYAVIYL